VGLGDNLGLVTTAMGVETPEQFAHVRRQGCTQAQGYFLGRPAPNPEVPRMLREINAQAASAVAQTSASPA
jgi:EAL domain-containing protein (putative c-di-GMP-specific phosphodiesterase class I)